MSTTRSFNDMLNDYLHYDLLMAEAQKRNYLLQNIEKDNNWKGGPLIVPFKGGSASSFKYGGLTAEDDIAEYTFVRGSVDEYKEVWGTLKWNARDLVEHGSVEAQSKGLVSEQSFLRDLPGQIEDFVEGFKGVVSTNLLCGAHFAKLTANATANDGLITVDHPERFELGQKVIVDDDNSSEKTGYVKTININSGVILLVTARGGSTPVDFSAGGDNMTTAQNAKVYSDGALSNSFTSLRSQLLPYANGGSQDLFGKTKTSYPYLQSIAASGSSITAANILDKVFDHWTLVNKRGKGFATEVWMDYTNLGSVMKLLEAGSGSYRHVETRASVYGYTEIIIVGVKGQLKIVGIHEMDSDVIYFIDPKAMKLHSNGFFRKQVDPDGKAYFAVRATTGYTYICDIAFFGELVLNKPSHCGVLYSISY